MHTTGNEKNKKCFGTNERPLFIFPNLCTHKKHMTNYRGVPFFGDAICFSARLLILFFFLFFVFCLPTIICTPRRPRARIGGVFFFCFFFFLRMGLALVEGHRLVPGGHGKGGIYHSLYFFFLFSFSSSRGGQGAFSKPVLLRFGSCLLFCFI